MTSIIAAELRFERALDTDSLRRVLTESLIPQLLRTEWALYIDRGMTYEEFRERLMSPWGSALEKAIERSVPTVLLQDYIGERVFSLDIRRYVIKCVSEQKWEDRFFSAYTQEYLEELKEEFGKFMTFEDYANSLIREHIQLTQSADSASQQMVTNTVITFWENWKTKVNMLTPELIAGVKLIYHEYMLYLKKNPIVLQNVAWQAFEQLVGEILASKGFEVQFTGRTRNRSADVIAIRRDELGIITKYLVECKHHKDKVGLEIIDSVIGASRRNQAHHAMLVTTGSFTDLHPTVQNQIKELNLNLRDGEQVKEWLRDYEPRPDGGIWLPDGWDQDSTDEQ